MARKWIQIWESRCYAGGIPDAADPRLEQLGKVPSYRRICRAIMKNDVALKSLGYTPKPSVVYGVLKRAELAARPSKTNEQYLL